MSRKWNGMGLFFFPDEAHFLSISCRHREEHNEMAIFKWIEAPVNEKKERKNAYDFWIDKPTRYMPVYCPYYHIRIEEEKMFSKYAFKGPICLFGKHDK